MNYFKKVGFFVLFAIFIFLGVGYTQTYPPMPDLNDRQQVILWKTAAFDRGMAIPSHDAEIIGYDGTNAITITYKVGGKFGKTVGVMHMEYSGSLLVNRWVSLE